VAVVLLSLLSTIVLAGTEAPFDCAMVLRIIG
jgi:hypothetical protein